ncbi:MAG: LysR family transcriptional regulator [Burkholderiales bacterium]|nr:LysR family transcriptional regulator [Burkholderiales bacterium]
MAPRLSIRIDYPAGRLGPGKQELLEHIARHGSIAAAARAMDMSYKRAWELVDTLNHMFREPVVSSQPGRNTAGATAITPFGRQVVAQYRAAEGRAAAAAAAALAELSAAARPGPRRAPSPSPAAAPQPARKRS